MIRIKIVTLFLAFAVIFSALVAVINRFYLIPCLIKLEQVEAKRNLIQFKDLLNRELTHLDVLCRDWASWDDTYEFIQDKNKDYAESNLINSSFYLNKIDIVFYFDNNRNIVWSGQFGLSANDPKYLTDNWYSDYGNLIFNNNDTSNLTGIIVSGKNIIFISSRPILKSDGSGPIRGTMVMGRVLNKKYKNVLKQITKIPFEMWLACDKSIPPDVLAAKEKISHKNDIYIDSSVDKIMNIFTFLKDINGDNKIVLEAHFKKEIVSRATVIFNVVLVILLICPILLFTILYLLINKIIITRLSAIINHIRTIKQSNDLTLKMEKTEKDEIGILSNELDILFDQLNMLNMANEEIQRHLNEKNEILNQLNITDVLTNVYNKRHLIEVANIQFNCARRHNYPLSLLILDIDNFKKINDYFGHQVGDTVLKSIAFLLKETIRKEDYVARFGGEEFVVLAPLTDQNGIHQLAERLRIAVEQNKVEIEKDVFVSVTASFGVATYTNNNYHNIDSLLRDADDALLKSKRNGKNQVTHFSDQKTQAE